MILVRIRRPNGLTVLLRIADDDRLDELLARAEAAFPEPRISPDEHTIILERTAA